MLRNLLTSLVSLPLFAIALTVLRRPLAAGAIELFIELRLEDHDFCFVVNFSDAQEGEN